MLGYPPDPPLGPWWLTGDPPTPPSRPPKVFALYALMDVTGLRWCAAAWMFMGCSREGAYEGRGWMHALDQRLSQCVSYPTGGGGCWGGVSEVVGGWVSNRPPSPPPVV